MEEYGLFGYGLFSFGIDSACRAKIFTKGICDIRLECYEDQAGV